MNRPYLWAVALVLVAVLCPGEARALRFSNNEYTFGKLEDFGACQQQDDTGRYCMDALDRWLKTNPQDGFAAAKLVRLHMNAQTAVPYFAQVHDRPAGFCRDPDLRLAILAALALPHSDKGALPQAKKIAFDECFADLEGPIREELHDPAVSQNACAQFLQRNLLVGLQKKKCEALQ